MNDYMTPEEYSAYWEQMFETVDSNVVAVLAVMVLLVTFLIIAFAVVSYILNGLGLYAIADRRALNRKWLAWVPVVNVWLLGSISDQYVYLTLGKVQNRRKTLLILALGIYVANILFEELLITRTGVLCGILLLLAASVVFLVISYLAYYDLYHSCAPDKGALRVILSVMFPVTVPFFVFACRKSDRGMPPRKQVPVQETVPMQVTEEPIEGPAEVIPEEPAEETEE